MIIKITGGRMVVITKITKFSGYKRVGCEQEEASTGGLTHTILAQLKTFDHFFNVIAWKTIFMLIFNISNRSDMLFMLDSTTYVTIKT